MRKPGFDYTTPGAYFITTCTKGRQLLFEDPRARKTVELTWLGLRNYFRHVDLDLFVVMPNHLHGIVILGERSGAADTAGEGCLPSSTAAVVTERQPSPADVRERSLRYGIPGVRTFKTISARRVNDLFDTRFASVWQRSYWDDIVHTEGSLDRIRRYILDNPANWHSDPHNPTNDFASEDELWHAYASGLGQAGSNQ
jgi:REP-associated tyrosine transposase